MGRFLKDAKGNIVTVSGAPVLEKTLDRKPRDCEGCSFAKWVKGDKLYIVQNSNGAMEWLCPDCACEKGLPEEYYKRNHYAPHNARIAAVQEKMEAQRKASVSSTSDFAACMCGF